MGHGQRTPQGAGSLLLARTLRTRGQRWQHHAAGCGIQNDVPARQHAGCPSMAMILWIAKLCHLVERNVARGSQRGHDLALIRLLVDLG
jgi:hypothetical protein